MTQVMTVKQLEKLIDDLADLGFYPVVRKNEIYNDEPPFFSYSTWLKIAKKNSDGFIKKEGITGSGVSFFSSQEALTRSLYEAMERLCENSYKKSQIRFMKSKYNPSAFMDMSRFSDKPRIEDKKIGWVKSFNLTKNTKDFVPAEFVYLNYKKPKSEPTFKYPNNSNGSAAGNSYEQAILNGIYELVERDGFMTVYLNSIAPPIVDLSSITDARIKKIIKKIEKYNLNLHILNTTTDIGIPSFAALIIDKLGYPSIAVGSKAGLRFVDSIIGAILEALMIRTYMKNMIKEGSIASDLSSGKTVFAERARHWIMPGAFKNISFLTEGPKVKLKQIKEPNNLKSELALVLDRLKKGGRQVYSIDTRIPEFSRLNYYVFQILIPDLQPLYLYESEKERSLNFNRLKQSAKFFGREFGEVNIIPHPFL